MNAQGALQAAAGITDREFRKISSWLFQRSGIHLAQQKKALVAGRLANRLRHHKLENYGNYFELLHDPAHPEEAQIATDLLTTNETYFFREAKHFDFLREQILPVHPRTRPFRVWSAACSSGEEAYSTGMTLASHLGDAPWEILASDLSMRVLERARTATYTMERAKTVPLRDLHVHCLKGVGGDSGTFKVGPHITSRVRFSQINLNRPLPPIGDFDLILLRNVMIYFDAGTKQQVVTRIVERLRPGGHLFIGHSESLTSIESALQSLAPATYRKASSE